MAVALIDLAHDALRTAESDPNRGADAARVVQARARAAGDQLAWSVAAHALGVAAQNAGDLDQAIAHLRAAIARAGSSPTGTQARLSLAFVLSSRGLPRRALREIDIALSELTGHELAQGQAQRGAILHQLGRIDDALACYNAALPVLRKANDERWLWRVLSNRAVLHGHRLELGAAIADLHEAGEVCKRIGRHVSYAYVQQNLGWIYTLAGDVPTALAYLDVAEQRLRSLQAQLGEVLRDRSEVLLSVHLIAEARVAAETAIEALTRERRLYTLPEARLLLARAALLAGEPHLALDQARQARDEARRQDRTDWGAVARYAVLTARRATPDGRPPGFGELVGVADELDATQWPALAVDARLAAADRALALGRRADAIAQLAMIGSPRRRGPVTLRAARWEAAARKRLAEGDAAGAARGARAGLQLVDEHHATYRATDLRARAAAQRNSLSRIGLHVALESGRPQRILEWAERGRARLLSTRPVRAPSDPVLAALLAALRSTVLRLIEQRRAGRNPERLVARQVALERQIRDHTRRQSGAAAVAGPVRVATLAGQLGSAVLIEFLTVDDRILAVTVARGRTRLWPMATVAAVREALDRMPVALRRLSRPQTTPASAAAATGVLRDAAARLDAALLAPLAGEIDDAPLVIVPSDHLQSVPWSLLPRCAGRPVVTTPSATSWSIAADTPSSGSASATVIAGPGLVGAEAEARTVGDIYGVEPIIGSAATVDATVDALKRADVVHLATHGRLHLDNALFTALNLADGPFMIYDVELLSRVPRTLVLAACNSGRNVVGTGDEVLGLAAAFLAQGARQLVASVMPIPDLQTASLMSALHRELAAGRPVAEALATAQEQTARLGTVELAVAAGFACIGAGLSPA